MENKLSSDFTSILKLNDFNGLMGPFPMYDNLVSSEEVSLNSYDDTKRIIGRSELESLGFKMESPSVLEGGIQLIATGPNPEELARLLKISYNANAADTTNADQLRTGGGLGLNLSGNGITVGVWDGGKVRDTHQEFGPRVSFGDTASSFNDHATHVAGTIGATGVNSNARGMANQVQIRSYDWNSDLAEMNAAASLIDLSNHSYGILAGWTNRLDWGIGPEDTWVADRSTYSIEDPNFGKYTAEVPNLDQVLFDNPNLLSVWSAGNDRNNQFQNIQGNNSYVTYRSSGPEGPGWYRVTTSAFPAPPRDGNGGTGYDSLPPSQNAKNSLVVGAIDDITADPYTNADVFMSSFSGWGPTDDGRIKPDVVGNGVSVFSPVATSNTSYDSYSGTSMAAPNVTGTTALLYEHWNNLYSGEPRSATMKGLVIHTAFDAGNVGPDYVYGWGVVDGAAAAQFLTEAKNPSSAHLFTEQTYDGTTWTLPVTSNGTSPLKATIVWTDPAGTAHGNGLDITTPVLVNDLDLWITGPDGTYRPWTLNPANPSATAVRTSPNNRDNVEQVLIDTPTAGNYTIHVGHTGNSFTQNFSLLVSGLVNGVETGSISGMKWNDLDGDGVKDAGESGLPNWQIYIDANQNGQLDSGEPTRFTDSQGNYTFSELQPGTYVIAEVQQPGWEQTFPVGTISDGVTTNGSLQLLQPNPNIDATFIGNAGISTDGLGTAGTGTIQAEIPSGSRIEYAFLHVATRTFDDSFQPLNIGFEGQFVPISWLNNVGDTTNGINFETGRADVTSIVANRVGNDGGVFNFNVDETITGNSSFVEGTSLTVIYSNPSLPERTLVVLEGGLTGPTPQTNTLFLSTPINKIDPNFISEMRLGIQFGNLAGGQYSTVDVNQNRLTSSAGDYDDGIGENGLLITVGGVGDSPTNPSDPFSTTDSTDDEFYDLGSFLNNGDTSIQLDTANPSNDDSIFLAAFTLSGSVNLQSGSHLVELGSGENVTGKDFGNKEITSDLPTLTINNVSITEGNSGTRNATFNVTRSGDVSSTTTVNYETADGTATTADSDYTATNGVLTFNANETSKTISVPVIGDTKVEPNETFFVNLNNPSNGTIVDGQGIATIINDDQENGQFQIITPNPDTYSVPAGGTVGINVDYSTSDNDNTLPAFSFRLHYDSTILTFDRFTNLFTDGLLAQGTPEPDTDDFDDDRNTDTFINVAWLDFTGTWPELPLPLRLYTANFTASENFAPDSDTLINFSSDNTSAGYGFASTSATVEEGPAVNLDVDGNGIAQGSTDGLLIARYLFGFRGNTLINGAIGNGATRTTSQQIEEYLALGMPDGSAPFNEMLDADGNGIAQGSTDGLLIARYLFGFRGTTLTNGAVGNNATRTTGSEIATFLDSFMPSIPANIDAVKETDIIPGSATNEFYPGQSSIFNNIDISSLVVS